MCLKKKFFLVTTVDKYRDGSHESLARVMSHAPWWSVAVLVINPGTCADLEKDKAHVEYVFIQRKFLSFQLVLLKRTCFKVIILLIVIRCYKKVVIVCFNL